MLKICSSVCLVLLAVHMVTAELFTALSDLQKIIHAERDVAIDLRSYIEKEQQRLDQLEKVADDYEKHSKEALSNVEMHLANPVNAFLLVKRFTADWDVIVEELVRGNNTDEFLNLISTKTCNFPSEEDLQGTAMSFFRLQDTYALSTEQIAKGNLKGIQNSPILTAEDCFELGRHAYNNRDYYHTVLWMQEAYDRWEKEKVKTTSKPDIIDYLAFATSMQGNPDHARNLTLEWLKIEPNHVRALNNKRYYETMISQYEEQRLKGDTGVPPAEFTNKRPVDEYRRSEEFDLYERLCRGEDTHKYKQAHKLTCQYRRWHPIHMINPLKEEVMYLDPFIGVYHDLITDKQIAKVKELAGPKLNRATIFDPITGKLETAFYRVSKSAWVRDEEDAEIKKISFKSAALSNLTLETVEELQVLNYGIGGHYEPHFDFARESEIHTFDTWRGNRIATVIYYMTDVIAGGCTVFPSLGVRLVPEKGACGIWYNLHRNCDGDLRTRHAACPVLVGNKWVCNKWFHERGQEFIRNCALDPKL